MPTSNERKMLSSNEALKELKKFSMTLAILTNMFPFSDFLKHPIIITRTIIKNT